MVKGLIVVAILAAGVGILLPYLVKSPYYPEGVHQERPSLIERVFGR